MKMLPWLKENKLLMALVLIGTALRCYKLDMQSIWIDEMFSMIQGNSDKSYKEIYQFIKLYDPHPPLYYFSLHFLFEIFGDSTYVARMLSVIYGAGGIFAIYYLAKELMNRTVGLIAAAIVVFNFFHIYYSQEARMYSMLFFLTTLSFYFLVRFIKKATLKSAILYAIFAALMIYTQFFALFALFSQYLILLFFVFRPYQIESKKFFLYCAMAGIVTLILYIPAISIFLQTTETAADWIMLPGPDFFTQMVKEFFGQSEIALYFVFAAILIYVVKLYSRQNQAKFAIDPIEEKQVFSFFILFTWMLITFAVPLIASYVKKPIMVNRYFINILPALIILVASGIYYIKNKVIRSGIIAFFLLFSFVNLVFAKDYYNQITKEQFRELTDAIKKRNTENSKVVMYWSWLLPYFFKDTPTPLDGRTLEEYVAALKSGTAPQKAFWYMDGHSRPFNLPPADVAYLAEHFILKDKLEYFDCWAHYYVPINDPGPGSNSNKELGVESFRPSKLDQAGNLVLFENAKLNTPLISLKKGEYDLIIKGISLPEKPIKNENAHIVVKMDNVEIANFYLSENPNAPEMHFPIHHGKDGQARFSIAFDNDIAMDGADRNAVISNIRLQKK